VELALQLLGRSFWQVDGVEQIAQFGGDGGKAGSVRIAMQGDLVMLDAASDPCPNAVSIQVSPTARAGAKLASPVPSSRLGLPAVRSKPLTRESASPARTVSRRPRVVTKAESGLYSP
jgi:hypothetical protein